MLFDGFGVPRVNVTLSVDVWVDILVSSFGFGGFCSTASISACVILNSVIVKGCGSDVATNWPAKM